MVVSLKITTWSAKRYDRQITEEVITEHKADSDAGRFNKQLASKKFLEPLQKVMSAARTYHYEHTLPWGENGERLLPSDEYFDYTAEMQRLKGKFEHEVMMFLSGYQAVIDDGRSKLGEMFSETDYPSQTEIAKKFAFKSTFLPVPQNDWRINVGEEEIQKLRMNMETEINTRLSDAKRDLWRRVSDHLVHMKERLTGFELDTNGERKMLSFKDSLFDNIRGLIETLPKLNVDEDPHIQDAVNELNKLLANPKEVRQSIQLRNEKAEQVEAALEKFNAFFPQN